MAEGGGGGRRGAGGWKDENAILPELNQTRVMHRFSYSLLFAHTLSVFIFL